jgi:hypothetical protein
VAENQELGLGSDFAEASANEESEGRTERQLDESPQHRAIPTTLRQVGRGRIGIRNPSHSRPLCLIVRSHAGTGRRGRARCGRG